MREQKSELGACLLDRVIAAVMAAPVVLVTGFGASIMGAVGAVQGWRAGPALIQQRKHASITHPKRSEHA